MHVGQPYAVVWGVSLALAGFVELKVDCGLWHDINAKYGIVPAG
jgi:hypothetical protein